MIFLTLSTTGLLSFGVTKSYRALEREVMARRAAEGQLEFLIESSPAAIVTMTDEGEILLANPAAHRLLGPGEGQLIGRKISRYVEALGSIPPLDQADRLFRTEMQTRGRRENGEVFLADVFFSTYMTPAGPRLSALLVDGSERTPGARRDQPPATAGGVADPGRGGVARSKKCVRGHWNDA